MLSLCRIDVAFRRLQKYDPDLDVTLLSDEEDVGMSAEERREFALQRRIIRLTLVARIADIVKKASTEAASLDVAVAITEILISTYGSYSTHRDGPSSGHKQAMQAVQLLASIYDRFDEAIDLFFDLVERTCAQSRTQGRIQDNAAKCVDANATRTMQNYDQMLLKLISKHCYETGPLGNWDIFRALNRIEALRDVYGVREEPKTGMFSFFKQKDTRNSLFCESYRVLQRIHKQRMAEMVTAATKGLVWTPRMRMARRSSPNLRAGRVSHESSSTDSKRVSVDVKEMSNKDYETISMKAMGRGATPMNILAQKAIDVKALYTITENSDSKVTGIETIP